MNNNISLIVDGKHVFCADKLMDIKKAFISANRKPRMETTSDGFEKVNNVFTRYKFVFETMKTFGTVTGVVRPNYLASGNWENLADDFHRLTGMHLLRVTKIREQDFSENVFENIDNELFQDKNFMHLQYSFQIDINMYIDKRFCNEEFSKNFNDLLNKYFVAYNGEELGDISEDLHQSIHTCRRVEDDYRKCLCGCCDYKRKRSYNSVIGTLMHSFKSKNINFLTNKTFYKDGVRVLTANLVLPEQRIVVISCCNSLLPRVEKHLAMAQNLLHEAGYLLVRYTGDSCFPDFNSGETLKAIIDLVDC